MNGRTKGKFASIIQLANQETEPDATLEAPPELEPTPEPEPMPKAVTIAAPTKPANGKTSKRSSRKQAMFYLPPTLSIELDQFVSYYNLEAAEQGLPTVDRSDLAAIVLAKLIELGNSKESRMKALQSIERLK